METQYKKKYLKYIQKCEYLENNIIGNIQTNNIQINYVANQYGGKKKKNKKKKNKYGKVTNIIIYDENDKLVDIAKFEEFEQYLTNTYIEPNDIVLELGARYGSVSCTINNKLSNKENQVSVEPDSRVYEALKKNKEINKCKFHIINGFISNKKLNLTNTDSYDGYGSTAIEDNNSSIKSYTLQNIIEKFGLNFNVLVADCEGCLCDFFKDNLNFIKQLRMIIFEADYDKKCDYDNIRSILKENGFEDQKVHKYNFQNVWKKQNKN